MGKQPAKTEKGTPSLGSGFLDGKGPGQIKDGNPGHTTDHGFLEHVKKTGSNSTGAHFMKNGEFFQGTPPPEIKKKPTTAKVNKPTHHDMWGNEL